MSIENDVRRLMLALLDDTTSPAWDGGQVSYSGLAEETARRYFHEEWLDDETHWIWDLAIEVGAPYDP